MHYSLVSNTNNNNNIKSNINNGPYKMFPWEDNYRNESEKKHWITDNSRSITSRMVYENLTLLIFQAF